MEGSGMGAIATWRAERELERTLARQVLDLAGRGVDDVPDSALENAAFTQKAFLNNNRFTDLPVKLQLFPALSSLFAGFNRIESLSPAGILALRDIRRLELNNNDLVQLPAEIGELRSLEVLNLAYNRLLALPESMGQLASLQVLRVENNQLLHLPPTLALCESLTELNVRDNPLLDPSPDVVARGTAAVLAFLRTLLHSDADATLCVVEGDGLRRAEAGVPALVRVRAVDQLGRPRVRGGDDFTFSLVGPTDRVEIRGEDCGDGTYEIVYCTTVAGTYQLHAALGGASLPGSPFEVVVDPAPTHPPSCTVSGPGLFAATVGQRTSIDIQACDTHGNARRCGGDVVRVYAASVNGTVQGAVVDQGDGRYRASYVPGPGPALELAVLVQEQHVAGSPFTVAVQPAPAAVQAREVSVTRPSFVERALAGTRARAVPRWMADGRR